MKVIVTMVGWKDYPKPNLRFIRNVWVVERWASDQATPTGIVNRPLNRSNFKLGELNTFNYLIKTF